MSTHGVRRRGRPSCPALLLVGCWCVVPAYADWRDAFVTPDQRASSLHKDGDIDALLEQSPDARWRGIALSAKGDHDAAATAFGEALDGATTIEAAREARYNQAVEATRAGRYADAIAGFETVLDEDPVHEDALANLAIAERLAELEQQPTPDQQPQQGGASDQQDSANDQPEAGDDSAASDGESSEGSEPGEAEQSSDGEQPGDPEDSENDDPETDDSGADDSGADDSEGDDTGADDSEGNDSEGESESSAANAANESADSPGDSAPGDGADARAGDEANAEALPSDVAREDAAAAAALAAEADSNGDVQADETGATLAAPSESSMSESEQATEQWLRRIPDDPAGLLRRKLEQSHRSQYPEVRSGADVW